MAEDWSDKEVELIVADYFSMLRDELKDVEVNKTNHRKLIMPFLNNRSHGSVEFKHQNISAVLIEMGLPFIKGYKPRYNFQRTKLISKVESFLRSQSDAEQLFENFSDSIGAINENVDFANLLVLPPEVKEIHKNTEPIIRPLKINYLEREQNNRNLGLRGEELVMLYERYALITAGKENLADKIEWVSKDIGDGLGYDILSRNLNGSDKYVEVKTTKLSKETPFFFSINEYNFSIKNKDNFYLYRVFDFNKAARMFTLAGRYDQFCQMEAIQYKGKF